MKQIIDFLKDEEGATMVEYGVMIALITAALVVVVKTVGEQTEAAFQEVSEALPAAAE